MANREQFRDAKPRAPLGAAGLPKRVKGVIPSFKPVFDRRQVFVFLWHRERRGKMKNICEHLEACPFFKNFHHVDEFRMKGYKQVYCHGPRMKDCARLRLLSTNQEDHPLPDDLAPTGIRLNAL